MRQRASSRRRDGPSQVAQHLRTRMHRKPSPLRQRCCAAKEPASEQEPQQGAHGSFHIWLPSRTRMHSALLRTAAPNHPDRVGYACAALPAPARGVSTHRARRRGWGRLQLLDIEHAHARALACSPGRSTRTWYRSVSMGVTRGLVGAACTAPSAAAAAAGDAIAQRRPCCTSRLAPPGVVVASALTSAAPRPAG